MEQASLNSIFYSTKLDLGCSSCLVSTETAQLIRNVVGIFGNVVNLLLYVTPILTFKRVIKNKSTEEFSVVPYVAALLNSVLYTLYGSPLASVGWENVHVFTINAIGCFMETAFIAIYFWYATPTKKITVTFIMVPVIVFSSSMLAMSTMLNDHHLRHTILGSFGFFASASMYGSPLVAVKQVIATKSVEFMPLNLSLFSFLTSFAWMTYALLGNDILLASPNFIGVPLGILQLVVYAIYSKYKGTSEETNKGDLEKQEEADLTTPLITNNESN
ncbi:hypothetical protein AQUCO_01200215v1 [Aquilegia coerulea]|uniref:Bidirectional sugar transporter SWEET n=1 Tax=Aquilegia coerulea TaxID=218851 RepID=A0A2G5E4X3_AQUCA|nr:hypothetical protein AQUCO_01200215v1 [Aquilegia coerulea]